MAVSPSVSGDIRPTNSADSLHHQIQSKTHISESWIWCKSDQFVPLCLENGLFEVACKSSKTSQKRKCVGHTDIDSNVLYK